MTNEASTKSPRWQILVVGYGNEMRGDDAAGPVVARLVASSRLERVRALAVPVLLPDLVLDMAEAYQSVFVDASLRCSAGRIRLSSVEGAWERPILTCAYSVAMIAGVFELLHRRKPRMWLLEIPALEFDFGERLSHPTSEAVSSAVRLIRRWSLSFSARRSLRQSFCR